MCFHYTYHAIATFVDIATAAGPDLTHDSFVAGAASLVDFDLPSVPFSSLGPDKIDANDTIRLSEYDHTNGDGGLVPVSELLDVTDLGG